MGAYRDEHEEAIERHESRRDGDYLDEQRLDREAERAPLPDPPTNPVLLGALDFLAKVKGEAGKS